MPKESFWDKRKKMKKKRKKTIAFFRFISFAAISGLLIIAILFAYYAKNLPRPEIFNERELFQSTKIYDRTGKILLYEIYGEEKRTWVPLKNIPNYLKQAVIATEDAHFFKHHGIDFRAIGRSLFLDLKIGRATYGGSTLDQQLIRSTFLTNKKAIGRKIKEIILSLELDHRYTKKQILEWYLNQIPFGQNAYGVEAGSETYFGKPVSQISLSESAILAALIRAPSGLSPYGKNKKELLKRKNYVLERMEKEGFINKKEKEKAEKEKIVFVPKKHSIKAPYFTLWVVKQLEDKYGKEFLKEKGLTVYTTLDWKIQEQAEKALREGIKKNKIYRAYNGALIAMNPKNGEVLAMAVGNDDYNASPYPPKCIPGKSCYFDPKFNIIIGTKHNPGRQPGSAFKPFVYATAFEKGYSDKTIVVDEPTSFGVWGGKEYIPQNYDKKFRGKVTLREALAQSLNVPSVKVLVQLAGIQDSVKTAQRLGITTLKPPFGPSIVLGGWEVKPIDMATAYSAFANGGIKISPQAIISIKDSEGNYIYKENESSVRVLDKRTAYLINDILSDNKARAPMFGKKSNLYFENYQVAAKTGTTQNFRDAWTVGYTPNITACVWLGNNNNLPMRKAPAVITAGAVFHQFLEKVLPFFPKENFPKI